MGGFFYKSNTLLHITHEEGRALKIGEYFRYEFNLTDHLGNIRVSFSDVDYDGAIEAVEGEVLQVDQYYPFGMRMGGLSYKSGTENRYRYNGKELHQELDLGLYDYGFRWYDPEVARFVSVDPLAEDFYYLTTYQYASNSPAWMIDLDGLEGVTYMEGLSAAKAEMERDILGIQAAINESYENFQAWLSGDGANTSQSDTGGSSDNSQDNSNNGENEVVVEYWGGYNWTSTRFNGNESRKGAPNTESRIIDPLLDLLGNGRAAGKMGPINPDGMLPLETVKAIKGFINAQNMGKSTRDKVDDLLKNNPEFLPQEPNSSAESGNERTSLRFRPEDTTHFRANDGVMHVMTPDSFVGYSLPGDTSITPLRPKGNKK